MSGAVRPAGRNVRMPDSPGRAVPRQAARWARLQRSAVGMGRGVHADVVYPRQIEPGCFWMLTRKCTEGQFLLLPEPETVETFLYVLASAVQRSGVQLLGSYVASNHHHLVFYDPIGFAVEFYEYLHKLVARAMNAKWGRRGYFWEAGAPSLVRLVDPDDVLDKLVYCLCNPVKDELVETVPDWPGVNTLDALLEGRELVCARPAGFFRAKGPMAPSYTLRLEIPEKLGDPAVFKGNLRERVAAFERGQAERRRKRGGSVLGRLAVLAQTWSRRPDQLPPRGRLNPVIAAKNHESRKGAIEHLRGFISRYRAARQKFLSGARAVFPYGTYWLRRFANVEVEPAPAG